MLSLRRADHSSREALAKVVYLKVDDLETSTMSRPRPTRAVEPWKKLPHTVALKSVLVLSCHL
jgi:hypothetical protein